MVRNPEKSFSKTHNTKARRDFIDYDYLEQLSEEETKWLAQFSDEYYGAGFNINVTYAKLKDVIKVCKNELAKETNPKKIKKWEYNLKRCQESTEEYVQIYGNKKSKNNLDLRKCRKIPLYYKLPSGNFTKSAKHKYGNTIHNPSKHLKDCNERANASKSDLFSVQIKNEDTDEGFSQIEMEESQLLSGEEYLLTMEQIDQLIDLATFDD